MHDDPLPHEWPTDPRDPYLCVHGCGCEPGDVLIEDECPRRLRAALDAARAEERGPEPGITWDEALFIESTVARGALAAIVRLGHTEHCAHRQAHGDGECECRPHAVRPQPAPTPSTGDVWLDLIDAIEVPDRLRLLMLARRRQGIERYGVPLQRDNGRDHAADALQEALDGAVYCEAMGRRDLAAEFLGLAGKLMEAGDV